VGSIVHVVPFQASASVAQESALKVVTPTAVHAVAEVHDTPVNSLPSGQSLGVGSIAHVVPFQASASVTLG
jgi:hypothetical protein